MNRPTTIDSKTIKTKTGCGSLFCTIGILDGKPYEVFINGSKLGGCRPNLEGLARMITLLFKNNTPIAEIIDQLEGIKCTSCIVKNSKSENKIGNLSCPDSIAKILKNL